MFDNVTDPSSSIFPRYKHYLVDDITSYPFKVNLYKILRRSENARGGGDPATPPLTSSSLYLSEVCVCMFVLGLTNIFIFPFLSTALQYSKYSRGLNVSLETPHDG